MDSYAQRRTPRLVQLRRVNARNMRSQSKWALTLSGAICILALSGCATAYTPIELEQPKPMPPQPVHAGLTPIRLLEVQDCRQHKETVGRSGYSTFSAAGIPAWVSKELLTLRTAHSALVPARTTDQEQVAEEPSASIKVRVLQAYVDSLSVTKIAVVVLELEMLKPDGSVFLKRSYRGQCGNLNWTNGSTEFGEAMNRALSSCLEKVRIDLEYLSQS